MGRKRKTEAQRRLERFSELYRLGKAKLGFNEDKIAEILGTTRRSFLGRRNNTEKLKLGEFVKLSYIFAWSDDEILSIIHPSNK